MLRLRRHHRDAGPHSSPIAHSLTHPNAAADPRTPQSHVSFIRCELPLLLSVILSSLGALVSLILVRVLPGEKVAWWVFGAADGFVMSLIFRACLIACYPSVAENAYFNFYDVVIIIVTICCGLVGKCLRYAASLSTTIVMGAYLLASSAMGLIQTYKQGGVITTRLVPMLFFGLFVCFAATGYALYFSSLYCESRRRFAEAKA